MTRGNQVVRQLLGQVVALTFDLEIKLKCQLSRGRPYLDEVHCQGKFFNVEHSVTVMVSQSPNLSDEN